MFCSVPAASPPARSHCLFLIAVGAEPVGTVLHGKSNSFWKPTHFREAVIQAEAGILAIRPYISV